MGAVTLGNISNALADPAMGGRNILPPLLRAMGTLAVGAVRQSFGTGIGYDGRQWKPLAHSRPNGGDKPLLDKGLLRASISAMVTESEIRLQASHPGAAIHQFGGTVRATSGKMLAIPLSKEAKRAGRARNFPRRLFVLAIHGSRKKALLCERTIKSTTKNTTGGLVVHYVLAREVTIPARPYLGFSDETLEKMQRLLADAFAGATMAPFASGARVV